MGWNAQSTGFQRRREPVRPVTAAARASPTGYGGGAGQSEVTDSSADPTGGVP